MLLGWCSVRVFVVLLSVVLESSEARYPLSFLRRVHDGACGLILQIVLLLILLVCRRMPVECRRSAHFRQVLLLTI